MRFLGFVAVIFLVISCDDQRVFEQNTDLKNRIWTADSVLSFQFNVEDLSTQYNIYINLRNTVSYPFENIYINYNLSDTLNNELSKELVNFDLFDSKTGQPFGEGLGDIFDHQLLLKENYKFDRPGPYVFELQQYMRMDSLPEVVSAGIRVERVEKTNE